MSPSISENNALASSGILKGYADRDLSSQVLGAFKNQVQNLILLGSGDFKIGLEMKPEEYSRKGVFQISVYASDKQILWVTAFNGLPIKETLENVNRCLETHSIAPLQQFLKSAPNHSKVENFEEPQNRKLFNQLLFCNQFRRVQVPSAAEFYSRIAAQPYICLRDFAGPILEESTDTLSVRAVPINKIIGTANDDTDWSINADRGESYLHEMAKSIISANLLLPAQASETHLVQIGAAYFVTTNGRHRVAALKGLDLENGTIMATVRQIQFPRDVSVFTDAEIRMIEERTAQGLIENYEIVDGPRSTAFADLYAKYHIANVKVPWAFANNLEKAASVYSAVSG